MQTRKVKLCCLQFKSQDHRHLLCLLFTACRQLHDTGKAVHQSMPKHQWHTSICHTWQLSSNYLGPPASLQSDFRDNIAFIGPLTFSCGLMVRSCWAELQCGNILAVGGRGDETGTRYFKILLPLGMKTGTLITTPQLLTLFSISQFSRIYMANLNDLADL